MRKIKVKTGCRTCKIRKIKCDEQRPACLRCVVSGRTCDGYGIWELPSATVSRNARGDAGTNKVLEPLGTMSLRPSCTLEERDCLDWFAHKSVTKLPGSFVSPFWTSIVLQACSTEPTVFHALVALGSVHKHESIACLDQKYSLDAGPKQRRFLLQHYVSSLAHLKSCFPSNDRKTIRTILITCMIFVNVDLLCGNFESAWMHIDQGLQILQKIDVARYKSDRSARTILNADLIDEWIIEAFSRLHLMKRLFKNQHNQVESAVFLQLPSGKQRSSGISSFKDAWLDLQQLFERIFRLADRYRPNATTDEKRLNHSSPAHTYLQLDIILALDHWLNALHTFFESVRSRMPPEADKVMDILRAYYHMAMIMTYAAIHPNDEMIFDTYTDRFIQLLEALANVWTNTTDTEIGKDYLESRTRIDISITDLGWIAPLFYTAVKCRVHAIRLQAIRLLHLSLHREGIWDAKAMGCAAKKVMLLEEQDFYKEIDLDEKLTPIANLRSTGDRLPTLPRSYRCSDVEVSLCGTPMDEINLTCTHCGSRSGPKTFVSTYSMSSGQWRDSCEPG